MHEPNSSARKKQWEGWAREWQGPVFGLVQLLLGRDRLDLVEDITQETFIRAFTLKGSSLKLGLMDSTCRLRYVKKIAVNLCRDHWRRLKRHPEVSLDGPSNGFHDGPAGPSLIDQSASPADKILQDNEDSTAVQTALHQLPSTSCPITTVSPSFSIARACRRRRSQRRWARQKIR